MNKESTDAVVHLATGAPELTEIEVTPAMIRAGSLAYGLFEEGDDRDSFVGYIY